MTGLEPATSGVTGRHSNHLSYTRVLRRAVRSGTAASYGARGRVSRRMRAGLDAGMDDAADVASVLRVGPWTFVVPCRSLRIILADPGGD